MKTTWNRPWIAATVVTVLGLGLCEDNCQADSISVNFWRTDAGNVSNNTVEAGEVAGVVPVDGQFWNNIGVGAGNVAPATFSETLLDDGGSAAATIESTLSSAFVGFSGAASAPDDTGDRNMMSSYISWDVATDGTAPDDTGNITVSGLGPAYTSQGYDVYLYGDADVNNRTFTISIGGQTNTLVDDATYDGTLTLADGVGGDNENYTVFRGLTSPSFSIEMDSSVGRGAVNGMQIVS
ncbi:MAG: hypothetical protein KDA99_28770, partial [Planctomycetales bacterium]|nr:hypothetical protein [Planctomycetales bacterium]